MLWIKLVSSSHLANKDGDGPNSHVTKSGILIGGSGKWLTVYGGGVAYDASGEETRVGATPLISSAFTEQSDVRVGLAEMARCARISVTDRRTAKALFHSKELTSFAMNTLVCL